MDFGAQNTFKSYQEIPTGALRPRNDILGSAFELNDKLKFEPYTLIEEDTAMASNRINRINEEMQKSIAGKLRSVKDPRVANTMISVTRVETTPDLRYAKVYVSFLEEGKVKDAMKGLQSAGGWIRREVGNELKLRYTPELVWALDDSITYGAKMLELINNLPYGNHDDEE